MRGATNPGGENEEWVYDRFFLHKTAARIFVPSLLEDNPSLDKESYEKSLKELDPLNYEQLRNGIWGLRPSGVYSRSMFQIVDAIPNQIHSRMRGWDFAATSEEKNSKNKSDSDYTASVKVERSYDGNYYVTDCTKDRIGEDRVESHMKTTANLDGMFVGIRGEIEPGSSGKIVAANFTRLLAGFDVSFEHPTGSKLERAKPALAQAKAGNIKILRGPWNQTFIEAIESFGLKGHHDDVGDAFHQAFNGLHLADNVDYFAAQAS